MKDFVDFKEVEKYENTPTSGINGTGLSVKSSYSLVIKIKDEQFNPNVLNKRIVEYFKNLSQSYITYSEKKFSHFILDRVRRNKVQLTIEPKHHTIVLYPSKNCSGETLKSIYNHIKIIEPSIEYTDPVCITYDR